MEDICTETRVVVLNYMGHDFIGNDRELALGRLREKWQLKRESFPELREKRLGGVLICYDGLRAFVESPELDGQPQSWEYRGQSVWSVETMDYEEFTRAMRQFQTLFKEEPEEPETET
ncbi:hypothetical protein BO82DRAFT_367944 [Aspergillus uvarum CBS 121591]|uniref:Uncharacterized protein n=1 Tax=Aspergillus uvarum CBS 121591 TaxID=1448315 RepID=A0A319DE09_9EURO|nr:hypothetical protein BO82DRAFT_367944 [Aspergillus uvarum CBS 121591]PYH78042.1 hypothetical protein BO82DRAFT_367944 [Aspergillus uvarum CBS 121591]